MENTIQAGGVELGDIPWRALYKIGGAAALLCALMYLATNTAFSMFSLSQEYAVATTEVQKSILLAAGQSMLAITRGTGVLYTGMPLVWLAGLIFSVVMLMSMDFGMATGWVGILGFGLLLIGIPFGGHYTATGDTTTIQTAMIALQYVGGGLLSLA